MCVCSCVHQPYITSHYMHSFPARAVPHVLAGFAIGHVAQWFHIRFACGMPWVRTPVCPCIVHPCIHAWPKVA